MNLNTFQKTAIFTVGLTLFLIMVGSLVRAAGAGLGCPDWPKCFGMWLPPTDAAALPAAFDASEFNVYKTWIEYLNRLVGVLTGLFITITFALSFKYRKDKPTVFYSSAAAFILVLIQGWLGGMVVKSALSEWLITIHMVLAMIIVNVLLYAAFQVTSNWFKVSLSKSLNKKIWWAVWILLGLTMIQLVLGTQVREGIDLIKEAAHVPPRSEWIGRLSGIFEVHRSFSWAILLGGGYLMYLTYTREVKGVADKLIKGIFVLIVLQILTGIGLNYLDVPGVLQVLHLLFISLMICGQFLLILSLGLNSRE